MTLSTVFDLLSNKSRAIFDIPAKKKEEGVNDEFVVIDILRWKREKAKKPGSLEELEKAFEYLKKCVDEKYVDKKYITLTELHKQLYYVLEDYALELYRNEDYKRSAKLLGFSLLLQLDYLNQNTAKDGQNTAKDGWKKYSSIKEIIDDLKDDFFIEAICNRGAFTEALLERAKEHGLYNAFGSVLVSLKTVYMEMGTHQNLPFANIEWDKKNNEYYFRKSFVNMRPDFIDLETSYDTYDREEEMTTQAET